MNSIVRPHHFVLLVLLLLTLVAGMSVESVWTQRHYEFVPEMVTSVPVDAQTPRWRRVMRERDERPAVGTVPRSDTVSALTAPPDSILAPSRGADRYRVFCAPCHGAGGTGDGAVSKRGMPPPPSLLADNARQLPDSALYRIIGDGQRSMPGYASQLRPIDRWNVILALRAMQGIPTTEGGNTP